MGRIVRFEGGAADGIEVDYTAVGDTWPPYALVNFAGDRYQRAPRPTVRDGDEIWRYYPEGTNVRDQRES